MFKWLKRKLREWLLDTPDQYPDNDLEVNFQGQRTTVRATDVIGLCLICDMLHQPGQRMIRSCDACDKDHYRAIWKRLGGQELRWEDGTPVEFS